MNAEVPVYGMLPIPLDGAGAAYARWDRGRLSGANPRGATGGPYLLAGYSFGGYLALEIAQRLTGAGERVAFLSIIDTNYGHAGGG